MRLSGLFVYPIKSAHGIAVEEAYAGARGLAGDRRFMIVDEQRRFRTQREFPRLALLRPTVEGATLRVDAPGLPPLLLPLEPAGGATVRVRVWKSDCEARSLGDEAAAWLSGFLGVPCELVYMPEETLRLVNEAHAPADAIVSFADGYPYLIANRASLEELQRRGADVPMSRFRPNLVIEGAAPFAEDAWRVVRVGAVRFAVLKPCGRCPITTVDQETAAVGPEPLRTLAEFRRVGRHVMFGQNCVAQERGVIRVGDEVEVIE